jgi:hypothetical protein
MVLQLNSDKETVKKALTLVLWPSDWILHHESAAAHNVLSLKKFMTQKSITEMEHPPRSSDLAPNDFLLFPKLKLALKG